MIDFRAHFRNIRICCEQYGIKTAPHTLTSPLQLCNSSCPMLRRSFTAVTTSRRAFMRNRSTMAHSTQVDKTYKETIAALNSLQSNAATILQSQREKPSHDKNVRKLQMMVKNLESTGIGSSELKNLSVIHVTGTKGKGSTCSVCESILRRNGYRTGLFSSPHLISVRERIQIDGKPIEEQKFINYFWQVMEALKDSEDDLPHYFNFLFVMAVNIFLKEKVDVAIVEVGIGGQYDSTNILQNVAVCGISNIGLDHTNMLGSTIAEIAWQKAGIMKPSAVAFSVPNQIPDALQVLFARSKELQCPIWIVPPLDALIWPNEETKKTMLRLPSVHQTNIALALQLSEAWMLKHGGKSVCGIPVENVATSTAKALECWSMPGRMQVLPGKLENTTFFIDGAHTPESAVECLDWFKTASKVRSKGIRKRQVLICNVTGQRNLLSILSPFLSQPFDQVYFTPNIAELNNNSGECWSSMELSSFQRKRLLELEVVWLKERPLEVAAAQSVSQVACVAEAVDDITAMARRHDASGQLDEWHVLVTGSLHLAGAALGVLDPHLQLSSAQHP